MGLTHNTPTKPAHAIDGRESCQSWTCRLTLGWFTPLAYLGLDKCLSLKDVWPVSLVDGAQHNFNLYRKKLNHLKHQLASNVNLLSILWHCHGSNNLVISLLYVSSRACHILRPLVLRELMTFFQDSSRSMSEGYVYLVALFVLSISKTLLHQHYLQQMKILSLRVQAQLCSVVYRKNLTISTKARSKFNTGAIIDLVAIDAERFESVLQYFNLFWISMVEIFATLVLIWFEFGIASILGSLVFVLLAVVDTCFNRKCEKLYEDKHEMTDERIKTIGEVLSSAKIIKMYAWENAFIDKIKSIRDGEMRCAAHICKLQSLSGVMAAISPILVSFITFLVHVALGGSLDSLQVLYGLSLFQIIRRPIELAPYLVAQFTTLKISVKRLDKFVSSSDHENYIEPSNDADRCISLEDCSFSWPIEDDGEQDTKELSECSANPKPCLKNISLHVKPGSFIAIVGEVGSGKSSLLSSILGSMQLDEGSIKINSSMNIAYVPQVSWIQNNTLRENILFGHRYDQARYDSIVDACALGPDFEILSAADLTQIGEKGVNLSGGQKQRVSLARACYCDADIYLLDDTLSAVDSHVGKHIFENILDSQKGLLRDKTRMMVTNNLSILPSTDQIIVVHKGRILEQGTYDKLLTDQQGYLTQMIAQYSIQKECKPQERPEAEKAINDVEPSTSLSEDKLVEDEQVQTGQVKREVYLRYFQTFGWSWLLASAIGYFLGMTIDSYAKVYITNIDTNIIVHLFVYCLLGICSGLFNSFGWFSLGLGQRAASIRLHTEMLKTILRQPMRFFDATPLGRIVYRFNKDIDKCDSAVGPDLYMILESSASLAVMIMLISTDLPLFPILILPILYIFYRVHKLYISTARQLERLESVSQSSFHAHFSETLSGVTTIKAYRVENQFIATADENIDNFTACSLAYYSAYVWLSIRLDALTNVTTLLTGFFLIVFRDHMDCNSVGLILMYLMSSTSVMTWLVEGFAQTETNFVSVERVLEYTDLPREPAWNIENTKPGPEWPSKGAIELKNYSTRYRPELDLVLKDISLTINPGEKIAIVGRTGAGKSSLTLALLRLIEPSSGTIMIDDLDITRLGLHQLRQGLTIIPQDPVLFEGTIRFNLDPFDQHSQDELWQCLELANLESFVESLEKKLDFRLTEAGGNLSLGQRQLMCLARALLKHTRILVLDEASSSVDLESDAAIQKTLRQQFAHCTVLTIAHRLQTILHHDRVLVLDHGRMKEFDSPQTLLTNRSSMFYSLARDAGIVD